MRRKALRALTAQLDRAPAALRSSSHSVSTSLQSSGIRPPIPCFDMSRLLKGVIITRTLVLGPPANAISSHDRRLGLRRRRDCALATKMIDTPPSAYKTIPKKYVLVGLGMRLLEKVVLATLLDAWVVNHVIWVRGLSFP